jgi:predicted nucleic acid-binding protein
LSGLLYLDTSAAVALLVPEPGSARLQAWLQAREEGGIAISPWVATEVASALSLKVRTGALSLAERAEAASRWRSWRDTLVLLAVEAVAFETAAASASRHELGVRAGDALHLAVAAAHGCTLVTLDRRMAAAGPELGVPVAEVGG